MLPPGKKEPLTGLWVSLDPSADEQKKAALAEAVSKVQVAKETEMSHVDLNKMTKYAVLGL